MSGSALSATQLRHPLASSKKLLEFKDDRGRTNVEPFEVLSRYETECAIAKGTYGFVARVRDREKIAEYTRLSGEKQAEAGDYDKCTLVAIKKAVHLFEHEIPRVWLCAIREIQLLFSFKHPNVMCGTDLFIPLGEVKDMRPELIRRRQSDFEEVYVVMPFMNYSLRDLLVDSNDDFLKTGDDGTTQYHQINAGLRKHLLYYISCGLGYIQGCGVMHRDLKPENILLTGDDAMPMICDFGQGREIQRDMDCTTTVTNNCTQWYAAPETLTFATSSDAASAAGGSGSVGHACGESNIAHSTFHSGDAWSLGCIAVEMLVGCPIFQTSMTDGEAQLAAIMGVLGPYTKEECASLGQSRSEGDNVCLQKVLQTSSSCKSSLRQVCEAAYARLEEPFDQDEFDLIEGLLHYEPGARWTCQMAMECPYFAKDGYESAIGGELQEITLVRKSDVDTATKAREYLWQMFATRYPAVTEMMQVLQEQQQ